jgi:hypothetical protein
MKANHTVTIVSVIVGMIIVGACAYIGYMIADTELSSNNIQLIDTQRNKKIFSAIGGGLVGLGVVGVIYWIIQRKEEQVSSKTDMEVLRRFSRYIPKEQ